MSQLSLAFGVCRGGIGELQVLLCALIFRRACSPVSLNSENYPGVDRHRRRKDSPDFDGNIFLFCSSCLEGIMIYITLYRLLA